MIGPSTLFAVNAHNHAYVGTGGALQATFIFQTIPDWQLVAATHSEM